MNKNFAGLEDTTQIKFKKSHVGNSVSTLNTVLSNEEITFLPIIYEELVSSQQKKRPILYSRNPLIKHLLNISNGKFLPGILDEYSHFWS